jgi:hypothetical protein
MALVSNSRDDSWGVKAPHDGEYVNSDGHRAVFHKDDVMPADYTPAPEVEAVEAKQARTRETGTSRRARETAD